MGLGTFLQRLFGFGSGSPATSIAPVPHATLPIVPGTSDPAALRATSPPPSTPAASPVPVDVAPQLLESIVPDGSWDLQKQRSGGHIVANGDSREPIEVYETRNFKLANGTQSPLSVPQRPWSALCYLELSFPGRIAVGTGCLIGPRTILTAAHNLYDRGRKREVTAIKVVPGRFRDGQEPFGVDETTAFAYDARYGSADEDRAATQFDVGVIFLATNKMATLAGFTYPIMGLEDGFWIDPNLGWINVAGFPAEKPQLMWAKGRPQRLDRNVVVHDIDTTPGQSGSPIYWTDGKGNYKVLGVHTDGTGFDARFNAGVRITAALEQQLRQWCEKPGSAQGAVKIA